MPRLPGATQLARAAAPLRPTQAPYHAPAVTPGHPSPGWYWRPPGVDYPAWLGYNAVQAEVALRRLLERERRTAA